MTMSTPRSLQGSVAGIPLGERLDSLAVDDDGVLGELRRRRPSRPEDGVVLEQVREGLVVGEIVDADDFEVGADARAARKKSTDAAEAVDADLERSRESPRLVSATAGDVCGSVAYAK